MAHGAESARVEQSLFVYTAHAPVGNAFIELCSFSITPPVQSTDGCLPYNDGETAVHLEFLTETGLPTKAVWKAWTWDEDGSVDYGEFCGSGHSLTLPGERGVLRLRFDSVPLACGPIPFGVADAAILVNATFT